MRFKGNSYKVDTTIRSPNYNPLIKFTNSTTKTANPETLKPLYDTANFRKSQITSLSVKAKLEETEKNKQTN